MAGLVGSLVASLKWSRPASAKSAMSVGSPSAPADFPYPVYWVPGAKALAEWERLQKLHDGWPIVIGDQEAFAFISEGLSLDDRRNAQDILEAAALLKHPQSLEDYRRKEAEGYGAALQDSDLDLERLPQVGDWPSSTEPSPGLSTAEDISTGKPFDKVAIAVLPTKHGWDAPAYLNWGGWNENPPPEIHVAALRAWHQKYGASLIGLSGDVMNIRVSRRPSSRDEALDLARQHYIYCTDIVDQGVETISRLAATYLNDDWWYFWWD